MQDLTLEQLRQAYDAALQQIAAESFFDKSMSPDLIKQRLTLGNNPLNANPNDPDLAGKLRMTFEQAQAFVGRYQIIDTYPDDATGFSAVAFLDTTTNKVIIAVRSTEFALDRPRDVATDVQIEQTGFAFDQILSMQTFMDRVRSELPAGLPPDIPFNLVGYSLSGNVVRTIAAMFPDQVDQTPGSNIVFNPTGMGDFVDPTGSNRPRDIVLNEMMSLYKQVEDNPSSVAGDVSTFAANVNLQPLYDAAIVAPPLNRDDPDGNVYTNARVAFAEAYVATIYQTGYSTFGTTAPEQAFTQFFGHALSGFDGEAVANSGVHPDPIAIPIEGQPLIEVTTPRFDFLNTHSLTLVTDSLRLLILFKEVAPNVTMDTLQTILQASSAQSADTFTQAVEADTLEKALDALRKVFLPEDPNFQATPSNPVPSGFGNLNDRTVFYNNITEVESALPASPNFQIQSLTGTPAMDLATAANADNLTGLAYRFALKALNPFAVIGFDYAQHNVDGALEVLKPDTATGQLTTQYLEDRADFLTKKLEANTANGGVLVGLTNFFNDTHFMDVRTKDEIQAGLFSVITGQREFLFDDDAGHALTGGSKDDHLYGGGGDDTLTGGAGNDYLEGDKGNDLLEGGADYDTYVYRINDNLDTINDSDGRGRILYDTHPVDGGIRKAADPANTYHGGEQGSMTYVWNGAGTDLTINNLITVQGFQNGNLGIHLTTEPDATIQAFPPPSAPTRTEPNIDFSNTLPLRTDYWLGIYVANYSGHPVFFNDEGNEYRYHFDQQEYENGMFGDRSPAGYLSIHAQGGDDRIWGGPGADQLFGDGGNDSLLGSTGNDQLSGGVGEDYLAGEDGNDQLVGGADADFLWGDGGARYVPFLTADDSLDGGEGDDALMGGRGADFLLRGPGSDQLFGDGPWDPRPGGDSWEPSNDGPDWLEGGDGNDLLEGGGGDDVLLGDKGNDVLVGDYAPNSIRRLVFDGTINQYVSQGYIDGSIGGQDWLDGGEGDDFLWGGRGNDTLLGGEGNDSLVGDYSAAALDAAGIDGFAEGDDYLDGGAGDDVLGGDGGNDTLLGGIGNDTLDGGSGDDVLDGGDGNDVLIGGAGTNVILFGRGSEHDTVNDANNVQATDIIRFADGISPDDVTVRAEANLGVVISINGSSDRITVPDFFSEFFSPVIQVAFADGTVWGAATLTARDVTGIHGTQGDDLITTGPEDNVIFGGAGNDTYVFNIGDGTDTIIDTAAAGEGNVVAFGAGVMPDSISLGLGSLLILYGNQGDAIHIENFNPNGALGPHAIESFQFADGTVLSYSDLIGRGFDLTGTAGDNTIIGTSVVDRIMGLAGNDALQSGDGDDVLDGGAGDDQLTGGGGDDVLTGGAGGDVLIGDDGGFNSGGGLPDPGDVPPGPGDGPLDPVGGPLDPLESPLVFFGGNDVLDGGEGDDGLMGNAGNDTMIGGAGNDIYVFGLGDGVDRIHDTAGLGQGNGIFFAPGITPTDLIFTQDQSTLTIAYGVGGDAVILEDFDPNNVIGSLVVSTLHFADGNSVSMSDLFPPMAVNDAPVLVTPLTDQETAEDVAFSFVVPAATFADIDAGDTLSYSVSLENGGALPAWLAFDALTGTFSGTPGNGEVGILSITLTATDNGGLNAVDTFALTVANVNDAPTAANPIADQTAVEDARFSFQMPVDTFADVDAGDAMAYSALPADGNELPGWLSFDAATRTFSGTPGFDDIGTVGVTVTATDSSGLNAADTFALTVRIAPDQAVVGTDGDDALKTSSGSDVIDAGGGNDTVIAGRGNDTITGGMGNDLLNGGTGNDTYIYERGGGLDQVTDPSGVDTVSFGAGISFDNTVARLTTAAGITTAHLRLLDAGGSELPDEGMDFALDAGGVSPIERFAFANGTTVALSDLVIQTTATQGTNGSDGVRTGRHDDVIEAGNGDDRVYAGTGHDTVYAGNGKDSLYGEGGNDALYGANGEDFLDGGGGNDLLDGGNGKDILQGGAGDDALDSGNGADTILFGRGDGRDTLIGHGNNQGDAIRFSSGINPIDLVLSRQANDLRVAIHGSDDRMTIQGWYADNANQAKEFEAGSGNVLHDQKVDQLIQAMAQFSSESGLSWDQAIDQRPQDVQTILAASWQ